MKLLVVAVGQRVPDWAQTAWDDYAKRFPPELKLELRAVKTEPRGSKTLETLYAAERERIEAAIAKGMRIVVLDERGTSLTTKALAARLQAWQGEGDDTVGTGMVGAPACGDVMKLQIKVNPATGLIEDARFKTYGCGSAIASSSLVTEWVKGKSLDEAMAIRNTQIAEELALPPVKIHCSILAEDAIKAAIGDYKARHGAEAPVAEAAPLNA